MELIVQVYKGRAEDARAIVEAHGGTMTRILQGTGDAGEREFWQVFDEVEAEVLAAALNSSDAVNAAYIKPDIIEPAAPNLEAQQGYLDVGSGLGFRSLWNLPGGRGAGVKIIDVENAWNLTHEDLQPPSQLLGGTMFSGSDKQHGTAVLGVLRGSNDGAGVTGVASDATVSVVSGYTGGTLSTAQAIKLAADNLSAGDVLLLELQRFGPRFNYAAGPAQSQHGCIPVEWSPDDYEAIHYATTVRKVIVVAVAGNGQENLDDALYDINPVAPYGPFPSWWSNPLRRTTLDAGSILVGAGYTPTGTYFSSTGAPRSRLPFSNHGSCVDVQAWGTDVVTTGYGTLRKGTPNTDENQWYAGSFSGTSAASPLVAGGLAVASGIAKAQVKPSLTPAVARNAVRATGKPQQANPNAPTSQRIGNEIDAQQLVAYLGLLLPPKNEPSPSPRGNSMASRKVNPLALEADRTDAVPTDRSTHTPSTNLSARYINEPITNLKELQTQYNLLWDEVQVMRGELSDLTNPAPGGGAGGGEAGDGTGGGAYPPMLHRWVCWKRPQGTQFIPDDTGKGKRLLLFGNPTITELGVEIRATGGDGPRYAMSDILDLDMTLNVAVVALVREVAGNLPGGGYAAAACSSDDLGYMWGYGDGNNAYARMRTIDDFRNLGTQDSPASPIPLSGSDWKLVELAKAGESLYLNNISRLVDDSSPWSGRRAFADDVTNRFSKTSNRVASGLVPRKLESGALKGLGNFTLGALMVFQAGVPRETKHELYRALRREQQQAQLSDIMKAPVS